MLRKIRLLGNLIRGRYIHIPRITDEYDGLTQEQVREEVEKLVDSETLEQLTHNYFVVVPSDTEEAEKNRSQELVGLSNRLYQMADTRTEVEVSGSLVDDKNFKTDKDPSELIR